MDNGDRTFRVGTRGSLLALTQTEWLVGKLKEAHPKSRFHIQIIQTTGDLRRDVPFAAVGTKGMFVKEIEQALLDGEIDMAVHSLKDLPGELPDGLEILCTPPREDPRDALIARNGLTLETLPANAAVGTSSIRRQSQLIHFRKDLQLMELRGNLDTRLRKLDEGQYDAIVLACAGLNRLGLAHRITQSIPPSISLPAVGQGALAIEGRSGEAAVRNLLHPVHDKDTADAIEAERGFQAALDGGCTIPAGAYATVEGARITLTALIAAPDGSQIVQIVDSADRADARVLGITVAERLLDRGGRAFLKG